MASSREFRCRANAPVDKRPSIDAVRGRTDALPFVVEGLMNLDYEEIYEI